MKTVFCVSRRQDIIKLFGVVHVCFLSRARLYEKRENGAHWIVGQGFLEAQGQDGVLRDCELFSGVTIRCTSSRRPTTRSGATRIARYAVETTRNTWSPAATTQTTAIAT